MIFNSILVNTIYKANPNGSYYGNLISVNTGINQNTASIFRPHFISTPVTNIIGLITQSIQYLYLADASYVLSNVNSYSN